jgi:hypothetical protein
LLDLTAEGLFEAAFFGTPVTRGLVDHNALRSLPHFALIFSEDQIHEWGCPLG